jgi:hypothetical protein
MTQMPPHPWNTILVPSGEIFGLTPDAAICVFVPLARLKRQIPLQEYAIFPASPAGVGLRVTTEVGVGVGVAVTTGVGVGVGFAAVSVPATKSSRATFATSEGFLRGCPKVRVRLEPDEILVEVISILLVVVDARLVSLGNGRSGNALGGPVPLEGGFTTDSVPW